jgi:hypothetical protein
MTRLLDRNDFYFVRLFCSFRPRSGKTSLTWARFEAHFLSDDQARQPEVHDLDPREVVREAKRSRTVTLSPSVKFQEVQFAAGQAAFGIEYTDLTPTISAAGDGESVASWDYTPVEGRPLAGGKWMHALVRVPKDMTHGEAQVMLEAEVERAGAILPVLLRRHRGAVAADPLHVRLW